MKKHIWKWVLLLVAVVAGGNISIVKGEDVSTKDRLKELINTSGTANIKLTSSIEMGDETLTISKGTITLDLNGFTLSATRESDGPATCISVNGGTLYLKNTGGTQGKITAIAKGNENHYLWANGYDAVCISYNGGNIDVLGNIYLESTKTDGWGAGRNGTAYTLDPNGNNTVASILPYGTYIVGGGDSDYTSTGLTRNPTTVALTQYTATFDLNGKNGTPIPNIKYTIATGFTLPELPIVPGYDMENSKWVRLGEVTEYDGIPVLTNRATEGEIEYLAEWSPKNYTITYKGVTENEIIQHNLPVTYTIESGENDIIKLPEKLQDRSNYRFVRWLDEEGHPITSINVKELRERTITAEWENLYILNPDYMGIPFMNELIKKDFVASDLPYDLPILTSKDETKAFAGWYEGKETTSTKITKVDKPWFDAMLKKQGVQNGGGTVTIYALTTEAHSLTLHWNKEGVEDTKFIYSTAQGNKLPTSLPNHDIWNGYVLKGWCADKECKGEVMTSLPVGKTFEHLYAKWEAEVYKISYKYIDYEGVIFNKQPDSYIVEENVELGTPIRPNYTFIGWHLGDQTTWGKDKTITGWTAGQQYGDKTLYAEWKGGMSVVFKQSEGGEITVKQGDKVLTSGTVVDPDTELTISAKAKSGFQFKYFLVNGEENSSNPAKVKMPTENGLNIYAVFEDGRPAAAAPSVSLSPDNVSSFPVGAEVKVTLSGGESGAKLYYSLNGAENPYNGPFMVSSAEDKVIEVRGISRKDGYKDGVSEPKLITFGKGQISITFDLPEGITAVNPDGGEVETAVATGGSFKFKLVVDSKIIETSETAIKVYANGSQLSRGTGNTYVLSELKENVTVTVGNVEYKSFAVKLKQTDGGRIAFVGIAGDSCSVVYGDTIQLEAFPNAGYYFTAWNDNTKQNPRELIVKKEQTVSATFSKEKMVYMVTFPQIEGVTVKTLSGYSQQVDKNGTCKFWLDIDAQYKSSEPVVKVNGEVIEPTETGVYSLYYIREHKSVSVEGITRDKITLSQKTNTSITNVETGKDATKEGLYAGDMVTLYAKAPAGKMFSKWNDGVTENPRMMTASDAQGVQPLFISASGETESLSFTLPAGAGVVSLSGNLNAVEKGGSARFKIVLLPQYAGSKIVVKAAEKVLQQEMELRASTEAETYVYSLNNISENTTVTVEGLTLGSYTLTLEQTENGKVEADKTGEQLYGTVVNLTATPEAEYMFLRWSDGNTLNPYPYTITKNVTLKAEFLEADKMVVDNEEIAAQDARIYTANGSLYVELSQPSDLKVWNFSGAMLINRDIAPGLSSYPLPAGDYLVRVGNNKVVKVMVK